MKLINAMFGRGLGGIEQASLDYAVALTRQGIDVLTLLDPRAAMLPRFRDAGLKVATVRQWGGWDPLAARTIRRMARDHGAQAAIAHGNRALCLLAAAQERAPVVAVLHNYKLQHLRKADAAIAITPAIAERARKTGMYGGRLLELPNMIDAIPPLMPRTRDDPPVIGAMGRFVPKKGFDVYVVALGDLAARGVAFRARLGGTGDPVWEETLHETADESGARTHLEWLGWVEDKAAFFAGIDVFCLPSLEEPFGIVLLEAFAHGVPVVTTDAEGPLAIARHGVTAHIVPKGDVTALADGLSAVLADPDYAESLRVAAHREVSDTYAMNRVGARLREWLSAL